MSRPVSPGEYVASVAARFDTAAGRAGTVDHDLVIAGRGVRLRFAGPALVERLVPAFAHRRAGCGERGERGDVDLLVQVFDSASTGVTLPAPPWSWDSFVARGDIAGFTTDTVKVAFHPATSALSVFDATTGLALWWVPDATQVPVSESGAPLRALLHWWCETVGSAFVHGASVGCDGRGVLLAGDGGAGKSSTALACVAARWSFVGDDYCMVDAGDRPRAHSVYCTAKVDDAARRRLPALAGLDAVHLPNRGKWLVRLWPDLAGQLVPELPVDAVLVPTIGGGTRTTVRELSPTDAVRALAASTVRQMPGAGAPTWRAAAALARAVPCQVLSLGTDVAAIPDVVASVAR